MADGHETSQEKTEQPSEKRKKDAREEGRILTSKELFVFITMATGSGIIALAQFLVPTFAHSWTGYFNIGPADPLRDQIYANLGRAFSDILWISLLAALPLLLSVLAAQTALGGINFSTKAMAFKPERINPLPGLKRMVSSKALVELVKAVLKVFMLGAVAALLVWDLMPTLNTLFATSLGSGVGLVGTSILRLLVSLTVGLGLIAALDVAWQRHSLSKGMMMSLQEVKDELKQTEGSPEIKGRIRRLQLETARRVARQTASLDDVIEATAIITNPTHFAVALKYVVGQPGAPVIVSMGRGVIAQEIIDRGKAAGITIMQSPLLARALYFTGEIGAEITDQLYTAVAAILAHIYRIDQGEDPEEPDIIVPEDLQFDDIGRTQKES